MKKKDLKNKLRDEFSHVPYSMVIDELFNDSEEIPQKLADYWLNPPKSNPPGSFIVCSSKVAEGLNKISKKSI